MRELIEKRNRYAKVYDLGGDQHRAVISSGVVHYQDDDGAWLDVQTTLSADGPANNPWVRLGADLMVRLPKRTSGVVALHNRKGKALSYKALHAANVDGVAEGGTVRYADAWPGATMEYTVTPEGLKTVIHRTPGTSPTEFRFRVTGLAPVRRGKAFDLAEDIIIPPAWATNSDGESVACEAVIDGDALVITCDDAAVMVDPTTTIQPSSADTWLFSATATTNYGADALLYVGKASAGPCRALLQFDLSSITASAVTSATLSLFRVDALDAAPNNRTFLVRRVTSLWTELGTTWANMPMSTETHGSTLATGTLDSVWLNSSVQDIVADWLVSGVSNYGFMLLDANESGTSGYLRLWSRETTTAPSSRPRLTINYATGPSAPAVNPVDSDDTTVTGTAAAGGTVTVKVSGTTIGTGTADASTGVFSVTIPAQAEGTVLSVTVTTTSESPATEVTVTQAPPQAPTVNPVYDYFTAVGGTAEAGSTVTVKVGSTTLGTATAHATTGSYSVTITEQEAGTVLSVTATNSGGTGPATTTTVLAAEGTAVSTWDILLLNIQRYTRNPAQVNFSERPLVPDPTASVGTPQSVLMGTGRLRKRRSVQGWALIADFNAMELDYYSHTPRVVRLPDGEMFTAYIERIDNVEMRPGVRDRYWYDATFVEK